MARKLDDELPGVEVEPERPRLQGFGAIHAQVRRGSTTDRGRTIDLHSAICQPKDEVLRPPIDARIEDTHRVIRLRIVQLKPGELCAVAIPASQRQIG